MIRSRWATASGPAKTMRAPFGSLAICSIAFSRSDRLLTESGSDGLDRALRMHHARRALVRSVPAPSSSQLAPRFLAGSDDFSRGRVIALFLLGHAARVLELAAPNFPAADDLGGGHGRR